MQYVPATSDRADGKLGEEAALEDDCACALSFESESYSRHPVTLSSPPEALSLERVHSRYRLSRRFFALAILGSA